MDRSKRKPLIITLSIVIALGIGIAILVPQYYDGPTSDEKVRERSHTSGGVVVVIAVCVAVAARKRREQSDEKRDE